MKYFYFDDEEVNLKELKKDLMYIKLMGKLDKLIELVKIRQKNRLKHNKKTHNITQKSVKNSQKINKSDPFWKWFYSTK